jgi:hypothetical protein
MLSRKGTHTSQEETSMADLTVDLPAAGSPGEEFGFSPPSSGTQYHFEASGPGITPAVKLSIWRGSHAKGNGVALSKPGQAYVDHVCGKGRFVVVVENATDAFTLKVTANSWLKKVFGWG